MTLVAIAVALSVSTAAAGPAGQSRAKAESVALLPIRGTGLARETLRTLDDLLAVSVETLSPYRVIAPSDMNALLGMEKFKDAAGCSEVECAAELAGALGSRYLIWSSVSRLGGRILVTVSLIDTKTHQAEGRGMAEVGDDPALYTRAIELAVRQLLNVPESEVAFAPVPTVVVPKAPTVSVTAPPSSAPSIEVNGGTPEGLADINLKAEKMLERALDTQESATASPETKAAAWCTFASLKPNPYERKAVEACAAWTRFVEDAKRAQEEQELLSRATTVDRDPSSTPEAKAEAWCRLAAMSGASSHRQAQTACDSWKSYAAQMTKIKARIGKDFETVRGYLALRRKSAPQKTAVLDAFLEAYGNTGLEEVLTVRAARQAIDQGSDGPEQVEDAMRRRCAADAGCSRRGLCSLADTGRCIAANDADCRASLACKTEGACFVGEGVCVRASKCRTRETCSKAGYCTETPAGACIVGSDQDCAASEYCRTLGACVMRDGRCAR